MSTTVNKKPLNIKEEEEEEVVNWPVVIPLVTIMVAVFVAAFIALL